MLKCNNEPLDFLEKQTKLLQTKFVCLCLIEICVAHFIQSVMKCSDFHILPFIALWAIDTCLKIVKIQFY